MRTIVVLFLLAALRVGAMGEERAVLSIHGVDLTLADLHEVYEEVSLRYVIVNRVPVPLAVAGVKLFSGTVFQVVDEKTVLIQSGADATDISAMVVPCGVGGVTDRSALSCLMKAAGTFSYESVLGKRTVALYEYCPRMTWAQFMACVNAQQFTEITALVERRLASSPAPRGPSGGEGVKSRLREWNGVGSNRVLK